MIHFHSKNHPSVLVWSGFRVFDAEGRSPDRPCLAVPLSQADGRFSDNWFALLPGRPRAVYLPKDALSAPLSLDQVQRQLTVRSVYDMG